MFYDLNIAYDKSTPTNTKDVINTAGLLGYNTVALNYTLSGKPTSSDVGVVHKIAFDAPQGTTKPPGSSVQQLSRITLLLEDNSQQMLLTANNPLLLSYDIVAAQPGTDALLLKCCQSNEIDIITFDMSQRLPFNFKPAVLSQAIDKGLYFEVCISQALKDALSRRVFISNVSQLVKVTRGKNILFSSGAASALGLRAPYDVINLASLFGIEAASAKRCLTLHARAVALHAKTRKTERGVLEVTSISDVAESEQWRIPDEPTDDTIGTLSSAGSDKMDVDKSKPKHKPKSSKPHKK